MNPLITNVMVISGISLFREKFCPYIRPTRESSSADDRIKKFQRVLTLFQVLTFVSATYTRPPNAKVCSRDWTGWSSTIANFSGLAGQILMEIILGVSAQMLVMYDHQCERGNDVCETVKSLREELHFSQDALILEREKNSSKKTFNEDKQQIKVLERRINSDKYLINSLYARIDIFKGKEKEKKELLSKLREKIEENTLSFAEGDYIIMMDLLKELYLNNE